LRRTICVKDEVPATRNLCVGVTGLVEMTLQTRTSAEEASPEAVLGGTTDSGDA
jgi:hypothetical protein